MISKSSTCHVAEPDLARSPVSSWYFEEVEGWELVERWDENLRSLNPLGFPGYGDVISRITEESVNTGLAALWGDAAVVIEFNFSVLGGTMGAVAGEKIVRAFDRAIERKLPVIAIVRTGGARMQEGMISLIQMTRTTDALVRHSAAGLRSVGVLRSPTTGGVYVSWASLLDLRIAESGATVGFAGPRVVQQVVGELLPPTSHTAESAYESGLVDAIAPGADGVGRWITAALGYAATPLELAPGRPGVEAVDDERLPSKDDTAMARVHAVRSDDRPSGLEWAAALTNSWVNIKGRTDAVRAGVARIGRTPAVVIAMDRHCHPGAPARQVPSDYQLARRAVSLANRWRLPIITLVDTVGAEPGPASERDGVAREIAELHRAMSEAMGPTVSLCVGEGGSGGAMAFSHADRFLMLDDAVYSVISPEGAATILDRDVERAPQMAENLKITADALCGLGVIDGVVAHSQSIDFIRRQLERELHDARVGHRTARPDMATTRAITEECPQ